MGSGVSAKDWAALAVALLLRREGAQVATAPEPAAAPAAPPAPRPRRNWRQILLAAWNEANDDSVGLVSAGVAFYGFLAMVPLLGAVVLVYGLVASPDDLPRHMATLAAMLPRQIAGLIAEQLVEVVRSSGGKKGLGLVTAVAVALFGARSAVGGVIQSLNIAYEQKETRGFIAVNLLALLITAGAVVFVALALIAMAVLGALDLVMPSLGGFGEIAVSAVSYAGLTLTAAAAAATLYRYGPDHATARWRWITPGTAIFAAAWMALTLGLGFYAANIGHYNATYGSLAGVVALLTWLYFSAYALLFGAEVNAELEAEEAGS
jgi:membrane protein